MGSKQKMVAEARSFLRLALLSFAGFAFYYAHLFFGLFKDSFLSKALAVVFLLSAVPLPIILLNNRKLFPELTRMGKSVLTIMAMLLLLHHFLMTFVFLVILRS